MYFYICVCVSLYVLVCVYVCIFLNFHFQYDWPFFLRQHTPKEVKLLKKNWFIADSLYPTPPPQ